MWSFLRHDQKEGKIYIYVHVWGGSQDDLLNSVSLNKYNVIWEFCKYAVMVV